MILALLGTAAAFDVTPIVLNGDTGSKYDIVIVGEGYAAADHDLLLAEAAEIAGFIAGVCPIEGNCPLAQSSAGLNIWLLEVPSNDSGAMHGYMKDGQFVRRTAVAETAFGIATAEGSSCWFAPSGNAQYDLGTVLAQDVPFYDSVLVVLNTVESGGCNSGAVMTVTAAEEAGVFRHEFGHNLGGLADEYWDSKGKAYTSTSADAWRANAPNIATSGARDTLPWAAFVHPDTDVPTAAGGSDVGAYEGGAAKFPTGVWRPVDNGTMRFNGDDYGEPEHHRMMTSMAGWQPAPFAEVLRGRFVFAGADDLVIHQGSKLESFVSVGSHFVPAHLESGPVPGWDTYAPHDRFTVGDYTGDGVDDLFVFNGLDFDGATYAGLLVGEADGTFDLQARWDDWFGGWGLMAAGDSSLSGDFDGDGADDLLLVNHADWPTDFVAVAYSRGGGFSVGRLYDTWLPSWGMSDGDRFYAADLDGDGRDEVVVANFSTWEVGYLAAYSVEDGELVLLARYEEDVPGWGGFAPADQVYFGNVDGQGGDDLILVNTTDWQIPYIGLFSGSSTGFSLLQRHDGNVPGWDDLSAHDLFGVGDVDADGCADLTVGNGLDFAETYVGMLLSDCSGGLDGWWNTGGELNVGITANTRLIPGSYSGDKRDDLALVVDDRWLVRLASAGNGWKTQAIYLDWVTDYTYHSTGRW